MLGIRGGQRLWDVQCKEGVNVKIDGVVISLWRLPCLVTAIHSKDVVAILHMLVAMARYFHCRYPLPRNVRVKRIHLKVTNPPLLSRLISKFVLASLSLSLSLSSSLSPSLPLPLSPYAATGAQARQWNLCGGNYRRTDWPNVRFIQNLFNLTLVL